MFLQFLLDHHHHVPCSYLVFPISMDVCGCQWKLVRRKVCPCSDRIARSWTELIDLFLMRLWEEQSWPWFRRIFHFHQINFLEGFSGKYFLNLFRIYMGGTKWCHLSSNCILIQVSSIICFLHEMWLNHWITHIGHYIVFYSRRSLKLVIEQEW